MKKKKGKTKLARVALYLCLFFSIYLCLFFSIYNTCSHCYCYPSCQFKYSYSNFIMFSSSSYSRRLLLHQPTSSLASLTTAAGGVGHNSSQPILGDGHFDSNFIIVLSIGVCATVCALALHFAIRCGVYCCPRREPESTDGVGAAATVTNEPAASKGVDKEALKEFPKITYSTSLKLPECTICLSDFVGGEQVRVLPNCSHGFHLKCIDKWLKSHTSCPNCRQCLVSRVEKSEPVLVPLPPEAFMPNLRSSC